MTNLRALIIDDDKNTLHFLEKVMVREEFEVQTAENGAEGLYYYLRGAAYDIVLLDLMIPEISGEEFLTVLDSLQIRQLIKHKPHIIIQSAVSNYKHLKNLSDYYLVHAICPKPIDIKSLIEHVRQATQKQQILINSSVR